MRQTILCADYDETDGSTYLKISNKYGTFHAFAEIDPVDEDIENRWDGFKFCEYKIHLKTLQAKIKKFKERLKGMDILLNSLAPQIKEIGEYGDAQFDLYYAGEKQRNIFARELAKLEQEYKQKMEQYPNFCNMILNQRRELRNRNNEPSE